MKSFLIMSAIFAMVLVAMPVIAAEPAGPPGIAEVCIGSRLFQAVALAIKEAMPIRFDAVALSVCTAPGVTGNVPAVIGSPVRAVENPYCLTVTLAGLMYGDLENEANAALKYLGPSVNSHSAMVA
ncbi:MAG: hypothetical protein A2001_01560 [Treponema sp. GWC1_61_84]|nr:MAG: hypothetical protein A2001_01560 [Treponema sp. GWC1_61_84]